MRLLRYLFGIFSPALPSPGSGYGAYVHAASWMRVVGGMVASLMVAASAAAQGPVVTLRNGPVFKAGPDYATDVLQDPWDFLNPDDIAPDPDQTGGFSYPASDTIRTIGTGPAFISNGWFQGIPASDPAVTLLYRADAHAVNTGRSGLRYPIDPALYRKLAVKMRVTALPGGSQPAVYWFHSNIGDPNWENRSGGAFLPPLTPQGDSTIVYVLDLASVTSPLPGQGQTGALYATPGEVVRSLRFDPVFGAAGGVEIDWVRLTSSDTQNAAAMTVDLAGCQGFQSFTVFDAAGAPATIGDSTGNNSTRSFNYGIFPPGAYTLRTTCGNGSADVGFTINTPPVVTVIDPDETGDPNTDYALLNRGGDRWDFEQATDVARTFNVGTTGGACGTTGPCGIVPAEPPGTGNMLRASSVGSTNQQLGDPGVEMLNGLVVPLNTRKHRILTFSLRNRRPYLLTAVVGPVLRMFWSSQATGDGASMTMSQDMRVWPGFNRYTIDMGTLSTTNGGIETGCGICSTIPWLQRGIRHLRLDPHEYGDVPTTFDLDDMTITSPDAVDLGQTFTVHYTVADADSGGASYTARVYIEQWDTRTGRTLLANLGAVSPGALTYTFNPLTSNVPEGRYAISIEVDENRGGFVQTSRAYATGALVVSNPTASTPRITVSTPTPNQNLGVPFTIEGCAYDDGRATGGINVDDISIRMRDMSGRNLPTLVLGFESVFPGTGTLQFGPLGSPVACPGGSGPYAQAGFRVSGVGAGTGNYFYGTWMVDVFARSTLSGEYIQLPEIPMTIGPVAPAGPVNFQATSSGNTVTVSWQAPGAGIAYYQVQVATDSAFSNIFYRVDVPGTGPYSGDLASGTYYLRVFGRTGAGTWTQPSATRAVNVALPTPPGAPTLTPAQVSSNPVTLAWAAGPGGTPTSYTVYAGTGPGLSNLAVAPMGGATSITAMAPANVPIYVRVVASNAAGSATSNEIVFTLRPPVAPALSPASVSGPNVTLQWSPVAGASSYTVLARFSPAGPIIAALPTGATSVTVPAPPGTYLVTVVANNGFGSSSESNQITVVVP